MTSPRELSERLAKECGAHFARDRTGQLESIDFTPAELEAFTKRVMAAAIGEAMHEAADIAARMTDNSPAFIADAIRDAARELSND